jgi:hypothetical protein
MNVGNMGKFAKTVTAVVAVVAVLALLGWALSRLSSSGVDATVKLPLLVLLGIVCLVVFFTLVAVAFSAFGLVDKNQALALPDGSVRAFIALILVVILAMTSIFFYVTMAGRGAIKRSDLLDARARDQFESGEKGQVIATVAVPVVVTSVDGSKKNDTLYRVYYKTPADTPSDDFAKQVLTLLGTLVTAVSAFYFGAKTAASAATPPSPAVSQPKLTSVDSPTLPPGQASTLKILGTALQLAKDVRLRKGGQEVQASGVTSNDSQVTCSITLPAGDALPWDVVVINSDGGTATLPAAIKAAPATPAVSQPKPTSVDPPTVPAGQASNLKILGTGLQLVTDVRLRKGAQQVQATGINSQDSQVTCSITLPAGDALPWDVVVIGSDGGTATLPGAIKTT